MKTKIFILIALITTLSACTKKEVDVPTPIPDTVQSGQVTPIVPESPTPVVETPPPNVRGADVTGKAQDMPEATKEGEHSLFCTI
jgi:hypothetical protein